MDQLFQSLKTLSIAVTTFIATVTQSPVINQAIVQVTPSPEIETMNQENTDIIKREGQYSYGSHTLKYSLNIPKNGGQITGSFSGVCEGPITGNFEGGEGGKVEGLASARCGIAFFSYDLKATYSGKLYLKEGKVDLNWEGEIPYTQNKGNLVINFEPVK